MQRWLMSCSPFSRTKFTDSIKRLQDITRLSCQCASFSVARYSYSNLRVLLSGFMNLVTRPFGGYVGDVVYTRWGTKGKKYWMLACGLIMGATCLAGGFYLADNKPPKVADRKLFPRFLRSVSNRTSRYQCLP